MFRSEEQRNFHRLVARHIEAGDGPLLLEGGTGLGKTRAYLAALADYGGTAAVVLPTRQLIDQLLASPDRAAVGLEAEAFRPAGMFGARAGYEAHRRRAMQSRVMLCTAASVMIDRRLGGNYNGAAKRDYILFDEADELPQAAALQKDLTITAQDLSAAGVSLTTVGETVSTLLDKPRLEQEVRAKALMIREALDSPAWYRKAGEDDDGGIALFHRLPGRLLRRVANRGNAAFISATLTVGGRFDDFRRSMGIDAASRLSAIVEPERHGDLTVETPLDREPAEVAGAAPKPCLVAVPSHELAAELGASMPAAVVRKPEETVAEAAARTGPDGILIAAGAWAGLDTPLRWRSIAVPRIPFGKPSVLDGKIESHYIDSRNIAVRRMRQVAGRGLRTPDARCTLYILDERYRSLGRFLPERFGNSWVEGARAGVSLSKAERDPAVRRAALRHYGLQCRACDMKVQQSHGAMIEIHHLDPIAEGERRTKLEDVVPLCRNCHALAHTETPPAPVERLRGLVRSLR